MRYLFLILLFIFSFIASFGQGTPNRASCAVTAYDCNLGAVNSFRIPIFNDTIQPAANVDSIGILMYRKIDSAVYVRVPSGGSVKKWVKLLKTGNAINSVAWGQIIGTLSNQTDLQNALNLKADQQALTDTSAILRALIEASVLSIKTLYNADDTLQGNRVVHTEDFNLEFKGKNSNLVLTTDNDDKIVSVTPNGIRATYGANSDSKGITIDNNPATVITDAIDSIGLVGNNLSTTKILANDTAYTRVREVKRLISDSLSTAGNANNGLSKSGSNIVLGQDYGASGNPAALSSPREIPMGSNPILLTRGTDLLTIVPSGIGITGDSANNRTANITLNNTGSSNQLGIRANPTYGAIRYGANTGMENIKLLSDTTIALPHVNTGLSTDSVLVKGTDGVVRKVAQNSVGSTLQAGMNTTIYNGQINANSSIPSSDTFYILASGQSNCGFNSSDPTVYDTITNNKVQIWNYSTNAWVTAQVGVFPFTSAGFSTSGNAAWYFAKKINETTGKFVKIVLHYRGSTPISGWFNGVTQGIEMDSLLYKANASGIPRTDAFIWIQGESDNFTQSSVYLRSWDSIKSVIRRQSYFPTNTPIIQVGMPQIAFGSTDGNQGADKMLRASEGNRDAYDLYANTDSCYIYPFGLNNHYNNQGLKKIGAEKIFNTYNRIPYFVPTSFTYPSYLEITHTDSASVSLNRQAVVMRNTSDWGSTGILMNNYQGNAALRFLMQNPNGNVAPFTANQNVISSENGMDLGIYNGLIERIRIGSVRTYNYNILNVTNTSATGAAKIEFSGDGSNGAEIGVGNASHPATPNSYYIYHNGDYRFIIKGGKIGIAGVVDPQQALHVGGQVQINTITNGTPGTDSVIVVNGGVLKKHLPQWQATPSGINYAGGSVAINSTSSTPFGLKVERSVAINKDSATRVTALGTNVITLLDTATNKIQTITGANLATAIGATSYTFSTGLNNAGGTVTATISTGVNGGQTAVGGTNNGDSLNLVSTTSGTRGTVRIGSRGAGVAALLGNITAEIVETSSTSLTLGAAYTYVSTNAGAATWTLPVIGTNVPLGTIYNIKNAGTNNVTLNRGGSDTIYTSSSQTSITILPGENYCLQAGTGVWYIL